MPIANLPLYANSDKSMNDDAASGLTKKPDDYQPPEIVTLFLHPITFQRMDTAAKSAKMSIQDFLVLAGWERTREGEKSC